MSHSKGRIQRDGPIDADPLTLSNRRHHQTPEFARRIRAIRERFFSRNDRLWPIFADPALAAVIGFRRQHLPPGDALSAYHRAAFLARGKAGLYTNWIEYVTHTAYDDKGTWQPIPGEKAVFFTPHTEQQHIDTFVVRLHGSPASQ